MFGNLAVDIDRVARTQHRLGNIASDVRAAARLLTDADLPGSPLAAPFAEGLRDLLERALAAIGEITGWAEQAQQNVRATIDDVLALEAEAQARLTALREQFDPSPHWGPHR